MPKEKDAPSQAADAASTDPATFEQSMAKLDEIVREMESEEITLQRLLVQYEEGLKMVQVCGSILAEAEKKVEIINQRMNQKVFLSEFAPKAGAREDSTGNKSSAKNENSTDAEPPAGDVRLF